MGEASDEVLLHLADLGGLALKPVAQTCAPVSVEMSWALTLIAPQPGSRSLRAGVGHQVRPDLSRVDRPLLVGEAESPDDEAILELRNLGGEIVGEGVSEILLVRITYQGSNGSTAMERRGAVASLS